jgi:hypothetical protein
VPRRGGPGLNRSVKPSSDSSRSALRELHARVVPCDLPRIGAADNSTQPPMVSIIPPCGARHGQGGWYGRVGDTYWRHAAGVRLFAVVAQIRRIA